MGQIPCEGILHILIGKIKIRRPFLGREAIYLHGRLPVVGREHARRILIKSAFHIQRADKMLLGLLIVHRHVVLIFCVHRRADEKQVHRFVLPDAVVRPVGHVQIIHIFLCRLVVFFAARKPQDKQKEHHEQCDHFQVSVCHVYSP